MLPSIPLGPIHVPVYPLVALLSMALSGVIFWMLASSRGWKGKQIAIILVIVFPAIHVGSKLFNAFVDHGSEDFPVLLFMAMPSGFSLYGGLLGGAFAVALAARIMRIGVAGALDIFSVPASFGFALGRVGCLLSGCCWGKPTLFPIALVFSDFEASARPIGVPLHATQVYDMALLAAIGVALVLVSRIQKRSGLVASIFFMAYPLGRFFLEFLRGNPRACHAGFSAAQWTSILVFFGAAGALVFLCRARPAGAP
jgi:phosphatidylglycerol:prolipoprotein diacylglycerol transferase